MLITIEEETGVANLVVWTRTFEADRRAVPGAGMLGARNRIQREDEVVHLVAHATTDLSQELASVGRREVHEPPRRPTKVRDIQPPRPDA
jgi:error-prone DNA polymerase